MVYTLREFFGTNHLAWSDTSLAGVTRTFTHGPQAVQEVVDARVWSGIHFRNADEQSAKLPKQVAQWRKHHFFQSLRDDEDDDGDDD
jgi:hypothetical protein